MSELAEGARLEIACATIKWHRGFESLSLRHFFAALFHGDAIPAVPREHFRALFEWSCLDPLACCRDGGAGCRIPLQRTGGAAFLCE
ncbi:hypothetical protein TRIP_B110008 [uncultured Desulfatiglans sp.]|uniref:Uncharacterized protein n=1 Tax=Uncultured Desulfatiglans sp. TaxID=1748965 RepID=A0A653A085_UNCDX|nr:hypothetical protein TRIP_B110008 [uncultured Desulfatiglans sp.]